MYGLFSRVKKYVNYLFKSKLRVYLCGPVTPVRNNFAKNVNFSLALIGANSKNCTFLIFTVYLKHCCIVQNLPEKWNWWNLSNRYNIEKYHSNVVILLLIYFSLGCRFAFVVQNLQSHLRRKRICLQINLRRKNLKIKRKNSWFAVGILFHEWNVWKKYANQLFKSNFQCSRT